MTKIIKGVNVIAVPENEKVDQFGGVYMAGLTGEPDNNEKDKRINVAIHSNKDLMTEEERKAFASVFAKVVAAYKRAEGIEGSKPKPNKAKKPKASKKAAPKKSKKKKGKRE